jgi:hypothetical protein
VIGGDLHQVVAEGERLCTIGCPILIDQIQQLLGVAAHCPGRQGPRNGRDPEQTDYQNEDGRQSRLRGAAILQSGASAATLESHHSQASAQPRRA